MLFFMNIIYSKYYDKVLENIITVLKNINEIQSKMNVIGILCE